MTPGNSQPTRFAARDRVVSTSESSLGMLTDLVASADCLRAEADAQRARLSAGKLVAVAAAARDMIARLRIRGAVPQSEFFGLVDAARIVLCRQKLLLQQLAAGERRSKRGQ